MPDLDFEQRPWGSYEVLKRFSTPQADGTSTEVVVKKISVLPGKRLSYQSHKGRDEHWCIVGGSGFVVHNDIRNAVGPGELVRIKKNEKHRIGNDGKIDLVFVEVSTGLVHEDDIVRYEDDFGRVGN